MRVINERHQIRTVAERWRKHNPQPHMFYDGTDSETIAEKLDVLDVDTAKAEDVKAIIGNNTWVYSCCANCNNCVPVVVEFDMEDDFGNKAKFCKPCLQSAIHMLQSWGY